MIVLRRLPLIPLLFSAKKTKVMKALPLEFCRVWSAVGPVPCEAVDPDFTIQSKSSDKELDHVQKPDSKSQDPEMNFKQTWM